MSTTPQIPPLTAQSIFNLDVLFNTPVFAGGIGLAGLGAAAAFGRRAAIGGASLLRRQMLVNVEISKRDPSYSWVLQWLAQPRDNTGFLARRLTRLRNLAVSTTTKSISPGGSEGRTHADFRVQPGYGRHIIRHKPGVYIAVNREKASTTNTSTGEPHEALTLTLLWTHRHVLGEVFTEAHAMAQRFHEGKTVVYTTHYMEEAAKVCDRVGIIDHGKLLALGAVDQLIGSHGGKSLVTVQEVFTGDGVEEIRERTIATLDPAGETVTLLKNANVRGLKVDRPDLETVFLALTGRSLRD